MKKKTLFTLLALFAFFANAIAQNTEGDKISFGLETSIPYFTQKEDKISSIGYGGSIKYDIFISSGFYLNASAQYLYFPYNSDGKAFAHDLEYHHGPAFQDVEFARSGDSFATIMIGSKFYFAKRFYGETQFGIQTGSGVLYGYKGAFVFSPGIGYNISNAFDVGVRYQGWVVGSTLYNQLTLRVAYNLDIKKIIKPHN